MTSAESRVLKLVQMEKKFGIAALKVGMDEKTARKYRKHGKLPTYYPEYHPVEFFWKWIKPKVYGFSALGGIAELIFRV